MSLILIFGDSITWGAWDHEGGWVQRLRRFVEKFKNDEGIRCHHLYNLGVNGNTTDELLDRFEFEVYQRQVDEVENILIFQIGANDSYMLHGDNQPRMSIERFNVNLKRLLLLAQKYSSKIIFLGLIPVEDQKLNPIPWDPDIAYQTKQIKLFNDSIQEFCVYHKLFFIDFWEDWINQNYSDLLDDGLHPNSLGHERIFVHVKNFLLKNKILMENC